MKKFISNTKSDNEEMNNNYSVLYKLNALNSIRQSFDRNIEKSPNNDSFFVESYSTKTGLYNTVNITDTTAYFVDDRYVSSEIYDDYDNSVDTSIWVYTQYGSTISEDTDKIMFDSLFVDSGSGQRITCNSQPLPSNTTHIKFYVSGKAQQPSVSDAWGEVKLKLGDYELFHLLTDSTNTTLTYAKTVEFIKNGSTWDLYENGSLSTSGISLNLSKGFYIYTYRYNDGGHSGAEIGGEIYLYKVYYLTGDNDSWYVYHNVPSGTFDSNISSAVGVPFIYEYEEDIDIKYKLKNSSSDTGWLNINEISTFNTFSSEPTELIVKLTRKSGDATIFYPSIKGFWVISK